MNTRAIFMLCVAGACCGIGGFVAGRLTAPDAPTLPPAVPIDSHVKVVRVGDGDTIEVAPASHPDRREKVRLLGLNAPAKGEKLFNEATNALASLVADKDVRIEFEVKDVPQRDDRNRVLAYVFVGDTNVNVEMIKQGWSEFSVRHGGARFADDLNEAESQAKAANAGVWANKK